ncbi:3-dehydroquinate dehydratase [Desulfovibrio sp. X2]|uniref:type II 3-dehydroquinate dehydratase n=1 Tax=Desulfovibrio sp. X2 TaxID=941449 RepID=UPI000358E89E|nr:type II 3-dehydroquinate dehydratase [Desulfovibrio sp. X2]EPR42276.1 3-dehydroquinate dehydratase [Desulfovibrio sp. X2]
MANYKFLIMNGPNLGHLGERQPEIYGSRGMEALPALVERLLGPRAQDVRLDHFQANGEGALIDRLEQARTDGTHGVVLNAGAYTHTSLALADCLAWIGLPCVEVHLSNVLARADEPLRKKSFIGRHCIGVIAGFGMTSYALGVQALLQHIEKQ